MMKSKQKILFCVARQKYYECKRQIKIEVYSYYFRYLFGGGGGVEKGLARGHLDFGTICLSKPRLNRLVYFFNCITG